MDYEASGAVSIPVIGMGGISCAEDAIEFMMAGARAVSVGTANFRNPTVTVEIAEGIRDFLVRKNISDVNEIVGCLK
jgi:dihydroorotate dehydrogenase (NAD+) catalytic subunit